MALMIEGINDIRKVLDDIKRGMISNPNRDLNIPLNILLTNTMPDITINQINEKMDEIERMIEKLDNTPENMIFLDKFKSKLTPYSVMSLTFWVNDMLYNGQYTLVNFINYLYQIEISLLKTQVNNILSFKGAFNYQSEYNTFKEIYEEVKGRQAFIKESQTTLFNFQEWEADLSNNKDLITKSVENVKRDSEHIDTIRKDSERHKGELSKLTEEAATLIEKCNEAFSASTTVGLAKSFSDKALQLQIIMYGWVILLFVALYLGINFGTTRLDTLINELDVVTKVSKSTPSEVITINWSVVLIKLILVVISFGGTIWAAWLATKQIGMYFRLSEDYGYKSALAKAYSGYKSEAGRIDETLYNKLFNIALDRLDESPIRLVDNKDDKNTPIQEFLESKMFSKIIEVAPQLKDDLIALLKSYGKKDVEKKAEIKEVKKD